MKRKISQVFPLRFTAKVYGRYTADHWHAEHQTWWMWRGHIMRQRVLSACCKP